MIKAQFDAAGCKVKYEPFLIPYLPKAKNYKPDWLLLRNGIIIETKGWFVSADRSKLIAVKQQHPALDIRLVFSNANSRIGKTSATTYGAWCDSKGFPYADKRVPVAWLREAPNQASLAAIRALMER